MSDTTEVCGICREGLLKDVKILDCKHSFHNECIDSWATKSNACPFCRTPIYSNEIEYLYKVDHDYWLNVCDNGRLTERQMKVYLNVYGGIGGPNLVIRHFCLFQKMSQRFIQKYWECLKDYVFYLMVHQSDHLSKRYLSFLETYWLQHGLESPDYWEYVSQDPRVRMTEQHMEMYLAIYKKTSFIIGNRDDSVIMNFFVFQTLSDNFIMRNIETLYPYINPGSLAFQKENVSVRFMSEIVPFARHMRRLKRRYVVLRDNETHANAFTSVFS